jgi:hypothetical protein
MDRDLAGLVADLAIGAEAMGLVELPDPAIRLDWDWLRNLLDDLADAGIARRHIASFPSEGEVEREELLELLQSLIQALEESPLPNREWGSLLRVVDHDDLARLLNISGSSLSRYAKGQRGTPDAVAQRLHFIARVVGDLKGTYNDVGIRRWFQRSRSTLKGNSPEQLLQGDWFPDDPGPTTIRALARSLVHTSAT